MESILTSIKKLIGVVEEDHNFDADILMHINSVFMILRQLGVGPESGFTITDDTAVWTDFIPANDLRLESVKSYIYLKVKLLFDPPDRSSVMQATNELIDELEWRLCVAAESE